MVDGGVTLYVTPDTSEEAMDVYKDNILSLIEEKFGDETFINELTGVVQTELVDIADQVQDISPSLPQASNKEVLSTTYGGLPIIGAVFLAVGIVGVGFVAYRWKRSDRHHVDVKGMQRLDTSDSYQSDTHTNDVTATDVGDTTATNSSESPILLDDAQVAYVDTQGSDLDAASVDTGAAVRHTSTCMPPELPELNQTNGDGDSVDFEAADGSGDVVSVPCSPPQKKPDDNLVANISPYCYPCLWPEQDEESKM